MKSQQIKWFNFRENTVVLVRRLTLQYPGRAFSGLLTDGETKKAHFLNLTYVSGNDETWHSYTLPKGNLNDI